MKKILVMLLAFTLVLSTVCFVKGTEVKAANVETYIGDLKLTKINGIWSDPTTNTMILLTPGQSLNALYYARLCTVYDSAAGCYVVTEKIATHCSSSTTIPTGGIGLAFNYAPISGNSYSNAFAKANWLVWDKIRVGDKLTLSGVDLTNKTLSVSGTWASASFVSNALVKVTTVRDDAAPKTPFTGKKIVCMGDSVTVGGGWTEAISNTFNTEVINSGFGGDTSTNYYNYRYQTHVAAHNPDIVFVEFGINDALTYKGTAAGIETYRNTLRNIYQKNTAMGATTIFMTPNNINISTYDGSSYSAYGGLQGYLDAFLQAMEDVANEYGCHFINIYEMWRTNNYAPTYLIDGTHPTSYGYARNIEKILAYLEENKYDICGVSADPTELTVKSGSGISIEGSLLTGVGESVSVDSLKAQFNEDAGYISVRNAGGAEITSGTVGTTFTVNLVVGGSVIKSYSVVIAGDVTGDGVVSGADYILVKSAISGTVSLNTPCVKAADFDGSGDVSSSDYMYIRTLLSK